MKDKINYNTAAVCGLFCGTCPSFPNECGGCLSENCNCDCFNGFKDCVKERGINRCNECESFPCVLLKDFQKRHIVNGICHHENVILDLEEMKLVGVEKWVESQYQKNTCKKCGRLILWYDKNHRC